MIYRYDNKHEYDLKSACREYGFLADASFWRQSNDRLLQIWNGVGAEGDWINPFIPETVYGLNISLASLPHDWGFFIGLSNPHYHVTNLEFLFNMNAIVRIETDWELVKSVRMLRTNKYYIGTETLKGWESYCADKPTMQKPKVYP